MPTNHKINLPINTTTIATALSPKSQRPAWNATHCGSRVQLCMRTDNTWSPPCQSTCCCKHWTTKGSCRQALLAPQKQPTCSADSGLGIGCPRLHRARLELRAPHGGGSERVGVGGVNNGGCGRGGDGREGGQADGWDDDGLGEGDLRELEGACRRHREKGPW
jgi:hypothetical protein